MKRFVRTFAFSLFITVAFPITARAEMLIPVGQIIGLELGDDTVIVAAFDDTCGSRAKDAGLRIGDEILEIDDKPIDCADDVRAALRSCRGDVEITVLRGTRRQDLHLMPEYTEDGPRLGVYLRQGISGVGTVTFYDPKNQRFGTLGHGVNDAKGLLLQMQRGNAYAASVQSVQKGTSGSPGQLKGCATSPEPIGILLKNTPQGVFGICKSGWAGESIPTAAYEEIHTGEATIRSTVSGNAVREYSVEILKIYPKDRSDSRNLLLKVTDPALLSATGGIVQGMSGSPIIQDGKLVGAVTHVLVNDPTTGYGICIENMLEAAE